MIPPSIDPTRALTEALATIKAAQRTIICAPESKGKIQTIVDGLAFPGMIEVLSSSFVPEGTCYIIPTHMESLVGVTYELTYGSAEAPVERRRNTVREA